ncbi:MAG: hypothetical protein L0387_02505 [Acidobacteria bacterium]|nr:hypothetical protein [Acidobacteriota bacterium]MCI0620535.1 hypothetical protein [Acidobacteriota bacterium]MCI0724844.1 hypothetical protein [Acidobacteriota bacterium]
MESATSETMMTRYLLGELSEQEATVFEERFFRDDSVFEELRAAEEDLIDSYVRGNLSGAVLKQFETHFLKSPARRQRVAFAKSLANAADQNATRAPVAAQRTAAEPRGVVIAFWRPAFQRILAAAAVLLAVAGVWIVTENRKLARHMESMQASRLSQERRAQELEARVKELETRNTELSGELESERSDSRPKPSNPASLVAFVLSPGLVRGTDEPTRLVVPREVGQVKLQLDLETVGDYLSYRTELRTAGGQLLWSQDMLQARPTSWGKAVVLLIPSFVLAAGEHELTLRGLISSGEFEDSGYYYFSVIRR